MTIMQCSIPRGLCASVLQESNTQTHRTLTTGNHPQGTVTVRHSCQTPEIESHHLIIPIKVCNLYFNHLIISKSLIFLWHSYKRWWGPVFGCDWQSCGWVDWPVLHWVVLRDPLCDYHCVHAIVTTSTGDHI